MTRGVVPHELADRIARVRRNLGVTRIQFARLIGVSRNTVTHYEQGHMPRIEVLGRIARVGGVTVDWLMRGAGDSRPVSTDRTWESAVKALRAVWRDPKLRVLAVRMLRALRPRQ